MSGEDVQAPPTVMIPLGDQWWAVRDGDAADHAFSTEAAARQWVGTNGTVSRRTREIEVARPTDGQALVLTRVQRMLDRGDMGAALMAFGDVLDAMIVKPEDREYAYAGLASGSIPTEAFADVLVATMEHFGAEAKQNGRPGAAPRKRATARRR